MLNFVLIFSVDDSVHTVKNECKTTCSCFSIVLNMGNLCQFRCVNNKDLQNNGNLGFTVNQ